MIETSESIKTLADALHKVQGEITGVGRNAANPFHKAKYANLEAVISTVRGPLQEHGVVFMQAPGLYRDGALEVSTQFIHAKSGEWMRSTISIPLTKSDPQSAGSAITYACRYSLMAMLGVPPVDDDGEAAMGRSNGAKQNNGVTASKARKAGDYPTMEKEIRACTAPDEVRQWWADNRARIEALPNRPGPDGQESWQDFVKAECERKVKELEAAHGG